MSQESDELWKEVQHRTFTAWTNSHLKDRSIKLQNLEKGLEDGIALCNLMEVISGRKLATKWNTNTKMQKIHKIGNLRIALDFIKKEGIQLVNVSAEDIEGNNLKIILGLIWTLILRYQINKAKYEEGSNQKQKIDGKKELLEWLRKRLEKYPVKPVKNLTTDWKDGTLLTALMCSFTNEPYEEKDLNPLEKNQKGIQDAENLLEIPAVVTADDFTNNPEELSNATYLSYFMTKAPLFGSKIDPNRCLVDGPGIKREGLESEKETYFTVTTCDKNGVPLIEKGTKIFVKIMNKNEKNETIQMKDNQDGTWTVQYIPQNGKNDIEILVNGDRIKGSPFIVFVKAGSPIDSNQCIAKGKGIEEIGNIPDQSTSFMIITKDKNGNILYHRETPIECSIKLSNGEIIKPKLKDHEDGTFTVEYIPKEGENQITIKVNGSEIPNSTFKIQSEYLTYPNTSIAYGKGLESLKNHPNQETEFFIVTKDKNGKVNYDENNSIQLSIKGGDNNNNIIPKIEDFKDGNYKVFYSPIEGMNLISIKIRNQSIENSPFKVLSESELDPSLSYAEGPGLLNDIPNEKETLFNVYPLDKNGSLRKNKNDELKCEIKDENGKIIPVEIKKDQDIYKVKYEPPLPGNYEIQVLLNDQPIKDMPKMIHVIQRELCDPNQTTAEGPGLKDGNEAHLPTYFHIYARDKNGNLRKEDDKFKILIKGPEYDEIIGNDHEFTKYTINKEKQGIYKVDYTPKLIGDYIISIYVDDKPIKNSPFKVKVLHPDWYAVGRGLKDGIPAKKRTEFHVIKNPEKLHLLKEARIQCGIQAPPKSGNCDMEIKAIKHGEFSISYTPKFEGDHFITVKINDISINGSPFKVKVKPEGADSNKCIVTNLLSTLHVGEKKRLFTIISKDSKGNQRNSEDDDFLIVVTEKDREPKKAEIINLGDGTYDVFYEAKNEGDAIAVIKLDGEDIKDSPIKFLVIPPIWVLTGDALNKKPDSEIPIHLLLTKDEQREYQKKSDDDELLIKKLEGLLKNGILDQDEFNEKVKQINEKYQNNKKRSKEDELLIKKLEGLLKNGILDQDEFNEKVKQIDEKMKNDPNKKGKSDPNDKIQIIIKGPNGDEIKNEIKDNGDQTYDIEFIPIEDGKYKIDVLVNDKEIPRNPFYIQVQPCLDHSKSYAEGPLLNNEAKAKEPTKIKIYPKDKRGDLRKGGDDIKVILMNLENENKLDLTDKIENDQDGTFSLEFTPEESGKYELKIEINDKPIKDMPKEIEIQRNLEKEADEYWANKKGENALLNALDSLNEALTKKKEIENLIHDYEERAKKLNEWIFEKIKILDFKSPVELGDCLQSTIEINKLFNEFKEIEKPPKNKEKGDLKKLLESIRTKQSNLKLSLYNPPKELSTVQIEKNFTDLNQSQSKYEKSLKSRLILMKKLEILLGRFNGKVKEMNEFIQSKQDYFQDDFQDLKKISQIKNKIKEHITHEKELKENIESLEYCSNISKEFEDALHKESKSLQEQLKPLSENMNDIKMKSDNRSKQLKDHLMKRMKIESDQALFAKNVQKLNVFLEDLLFSLSSPVQSSSLEDVIKKIQLNNNLIEKYKKEKSNLDTIHSIHESLLKENEESGIFSILSNDQITIKYQSIGEKLENKKLNLENEKKLQEEYIILLKEYESQVNEYSKWIDEQIQIYSKKRDIELEEQIEQLKSSISKDSKIEVIKESYQKLVTLKIQNRTDKNIRFIENLSQKLEDQINKTIDELTFKLQEIEEEMNQFDSKIKELEEWIQLKKEFIKTDYSLLSAINITESKIKVFESFEEEIDAAKSSFGNTKKSGEIVIQSKHKQSDRMKGDIEKYEKELENLKKESLEISKKLNDLLDKLKMIDEDCDKYAEDSQKMASFLKKSLLTLNEPIHTTSVEEVNEMKQIHSKIEKEYQQIQKLFQEIKELNEKIIKNEGDPFIYTKNTIESLTQLDQQFENKFKENSIELDKEIEKQKEYEKLIQDFNKQSEEYEKMNKEREELLLNEKSSIQEQKKYVSENGPIFVKESQEKEKKLIEIFEDLTKKEISDRLGYSKQEINLIHKDLSHLFKKRIESLEHQSIAEKKGNFKEEQLKEFLKSFKDFDKDKQNSLDKQQFKNAASANGMDLDENGVNKLFDEFDKNKDERITFDEYVEFLAIIKKKSSSPNKEEMMKLFKILSGGKDTIQEHQLRKSDSLPVDEILSKMKKMSDGSFDYISFVNENFQ